MEISQIREVLLYLIMANFIFFAMLSIVRPLLLARVLGFELKENNAWSEFYAIYFGVFAAQAYLAWTAAQKLDELIFSILISLFLLAQPVGRLIALLKGKPTSGLLKLLFGLEFLSGLTILVLVKLEIN